MCATWPRPSGRDTSKSFSTTGTDQHGKVRAMSVTGAVITVAAPGGNAQ